MSLGKKILEARVRSRRTQKDLSRGTGLAISYLSRLENDRVVPSVRTLMKISEALRVPVTALFEQEPVLEAADRCPVSLSGRCILDQVFSGRGRKPKLSGESYTAQQLEILRLCNFLLHAGDEQVLTTLTTLLRSLAGSRPALTEPLHPAEDG